MDKLGLNLGKPGNGSHLEKGVSPGKASSHLKWEDFPSRAPTTRCSFSQRESSHLTGKFAPARHVLYSENLLSTQRLPPRGEPPRPAGGFNPFLPCSLELYTTGTKDPGSRGRGGGERGPPLGIGDLRGGSSNSRKLILGGKLSQWGKFSPARKTREEGLIWRVLSPKGRSYLAEAPTRNG